MNIRPSRLTSTFSLVHHSWWPFQSFGRKVVKVRRRAGREDVSFLRPTSVHAFARAFHRHPLLTRRIFLLLPPPRSPLPLTGNTRAPIRRSWLSTRLSIGREPAVCLVCVPAFRHHDNLGVCLVHLPQRSKSPRVWGLRLSKGARDQWTRRLCRRSPARQQHFSRSTIDGTGPSHECGRSGGSRRHVVGRGRRR